ncbi:hypothetical protein Pcar_3383 [Syntrophotalea carbinolica DSM 2380]|uniref:Uncharacterized protein n=1 Tax=Syntrophotalea carbinolica (strain DSM 2380 / NBRC 103641 / GraBd1) TaxID=338963 RepID=Q0C6E0_SYNC1|nr:hypothetical protein Pcar_3383 [Syntrophotalea carbinolica DSM 2380]
MPGKISSRICNSLRLHGKTTNKLSARYPEGISEYCAAMAAACLTKVFPAGYIRIRLIKHSRCRQSLHREQLDIDTWLYQAH